MKRNFAVGLFLLFGLSVLLLIVLTIFDPALARLSFPAQRAVIFLLLVLPAGIGSVFGIMSLVYKEDRRLTFETNASVNKNIRKLHDQIH
jgi:uncharacterized membrane protein YqjE